MEKDKQELIKELKLKIEEVNRIITEFNRIEHNLTIKIAHNEFHAISNSFSNRNMIPYIICEISEKIIY